MLARGDKRKVWELGSRAGVDKDMEGCREEKHIVMERRQCHGSVCPCDILCNESSRVRMCYNADRPCRRLVLAM